MMDNFKIIEKKLAQSNKKSYITYVIRNDNYKPLKHKTNELFRIKKPFPSRTKRVKL